MRDVSISALLACRTEGGDALPQVQNKVHKGGGEEGGGGGGTGGTEGTGGTGPARWEEKLLVGIASDHGD